MMRAPAAVLAVLTLAACGKQVALAPMPGMGTVPKAATASAPETPESLLVPSNQARPGRNIDLVPRSARRADDPFDKTPSADNGRAASQ